MTTPETRGVEFEPLVLSFDEPVVECEENRVSEPDIRELSPYNFDSDDETLVGLGSSGSVDSGPLDSGPLDSDAVRPFDTSDRTLVGIGPIERAKRDESVELIEDLELVEGIELVDGFEVIEFDWPPMHAQQAEPTPESAPMPLSEPPGPFVTAGDDDAPLRLPMRKREPWLLALPVVLAAAAGVTFWRAVAPNTNSSRLPAVAIAASRVANAPRTSAARFEPAVAILAASPAGEAPITPPKASPRALAPATTARHEKPLEPAPRHASSKPAGIDAVGALDVTSNPPSSLVVDGRPFGTTPLVIQLTSGPHIVVFAHPARGRVSVTVNVRAGRTTTASANF